MLKSKIFQSNQNCIGGGLRAGKSIDGFTMVEIVVALAILGVTIVAVFGALQTCARAAHHARMLTRSVMLAESLLTEAKMSGDTAFETTQGQDGSYNWNIQVTPTPVESLGAIVVQVQWQEQQRPQQYKLVSLIQIRSYTERQ